VTTALLLLRFCQRHGIDLIHSHGRGAGAYSRFLGIFGFKVIHTFHGFHVQKGLKARVILWIEKCVGLWTSAFVAVSQGERDRALAHSVARDAKTKLIYNGICSGSKATSRDRNGRLTFGALTRFDPQKGNDLLVDFISRIPKDLVSQLRFILAGEGPELAGIEAQIERLGLSSLVELPGPTSKPDAFLESIDVFLSASRGEGLSYATLETLRAGRPLLLSRVTGHTELDGIPGVSFFSIENSEEFLLHIFRSFPLQRSSPSVSRSKIWPGKRSPSIEVFFRRTEAYAPHSPRKP